MRLSYVLLGVLVAYIFSIGGAHDDRLPNPIHLLKPLSGSGGHPTQGLNCLSWRLAVETDNIQDWKTVPMECQKYVGHYMLGAQYKKECSIVASAAISYVNSLNISKGKDIWVFDIDETSLSNLPYYARPNVGFGAFPYNATGFNEWQAQAVAPPISSVLNLYKRLLKLEVNVVFLTGAQEQYRGPKARNMKNVGYHKWFKMIFKQCPVGQIVAPSRITWTCIMKKKSNESKGNSLEYKSKHRKELEKMGYRIIGNIGDQWSDLLGIHPGLRTFKLPDPM